MYNLKDYKPPEKFYGKVKKGWHYAKIYSAALKNGKSRKGKFYQYIIIDFLIIEEDVLVPFFTFYNKEHTEPDHLFGKLLMTAGLNDDYSNDQVGFFKDLIGKELMVNVEHTYKKPNRIRRDRETDFDFLSTDFEPEFEEFQL